MEISGDEMHREKSDKLGNKLISKTTQITIPNYFINLYFEISLKY